MRRPVLLNRVLRQAGYLNVRPGPFGEMLDTFAQPGLRRLRPPARSRLCRPGGRQRTRRVRELISGLPGVSRVLTDVERQEIGLDHARSGDLVVLSQDDAWFAYPYWLDDRLAPDFARTVDIHRKPGYDPCELFFDPVCSGPAGRAILRLAQKKLGFRTRFDVVPLDPSSCAAATASRRRGPRIVRS